MSSCIICKEVGTMKYQDYSLCHHCYYLTPNDILRLMSGAREEAIITEQIDNIYFFKGTWNKDNWKEYPSIVARLKSLGLNGKNIKKDNPRNGYGTSGYEWL